MTLEEIQERLYSSTGITPVAAGPVWGGSAKRDKNAEILASYPGYTGLDKIAMDVMKQGYNVEDPTKTMTGLLETLAPNLSGWAPGTAAPRIATQVSMNTGLIPKTEETNIPGIIAMLAGSYTDRINDYLQNFQDLPDIRAAAEKVVEEEEVPWT
jgi:hypothetical protein